MNLKTISFILLVIMIGNRLANAQSSIDNQKISISTRTATENEFNDLKSKIGVYQEGVNYNVKFNGFGTGLRPPTAEQWAKMKQQAVFVNEIIFKDGAVPSSHDNSATDWFPPIGNQAAEGSCVAWATGYYNKTFQEAREHNWDLSSCTWENGYEGYPSAAYQDKIFSPDFIYHQINGGVDEGSTYYDALNFLYRIGCCTWDNMPYNMYNSTDWPEESAWKQAPIYRSATAYAYANVTDDTQINNLKLFLSNYNNAVIAIDANYYSSLTNNDLWTSDTYLATGSNHANLIVGYDDNFGPYTEGGVTRYGAFKVANSWGVGNWENVADGFYWMSYECMKQRLQYYMFYENLLNYEPELIAVFSLTHSLRGECQVSIGKGSTASPSANKRFDDYYYNGGNHAYPTNVMAMDITEFGSLADAENYYIGVYDGGSSATGQINSFSIEAYDDYSSGVPSAIYASVETPKVTVANSSAFVQLQTADDNTPPAAVSNLQVSNVGSGAITLTWTATGDDGNTGRAYAYNIRYSLSPINNENFDAATQVNNPSFPSNAGTTETFTISGLAFNTTYYFALKAIDDRMNVSGVSNSPEGTTLGAPQIEVAPTALSANLQAGAKTTQNFTISNTGNGILEFTIPFFEQSQLATAINKDIAANNEKIGFFADESRIGSSREFPNKMTETLKSNANDYELLGEGGDILEIYQNFPIQNAGMIFNNNEIYTSIHLGENNGNLALYNLDNQTSQTIFDTHPYSFGMAFDGEYLWIGNNLGNIYAYDLTGNQVGSFSTPISGYVSFTFDGEYFLVCEAFATNSTIYRLDYQGNTINTFNLDNYQAEIYSIMWVPQHADGQLWLMGYSNGFSLNQFSKPGNTFSFLKSIPITYDSDVYSIAHDGHDLYHTDWNGPLNRIDDGIDEGSWLTLDVLSGSIGAGASQTITATIDAAELNDGQYGTFIQINSNDPLNSNIDIPVSLAVTGIPNIDVLQSTIDFGNVYTNVQATKNLIIINTGSKQLSISAISTDNNIFSAAVNSALVQPSDTLILPMYITATALGNHSATLSISSDDPDTPSATVTLTANCVGAPVMVISPDSIEVTLQPNETTTKTLTISNTGQSELTYSFPDYISPNQAVATAIASPTFPYMEIAKGASDPRIGTERNAAAGGPDAYGYSWKDSNEPGGPSFDWLDISGTGTLVTGLSDDNYVGSFPIGFNFPFYENIFSQFYITSNGLIMFSNPGSSPSNQPIPAVEVPNNFIAWCWDDLYSRGSVHYQAYNDKLLIQFTNYGEYGNSSTSITAQVILFSNGKIKIQYLNTIGGFDTMGCTVGIENADGSDGLQVAFNAAYIEDNLALEFSSVADWITVVPAAGTLAPGASADIEIGIDAANMTYGKHSARVNIISNDPSKASVDYPVLVNIPASQELIDDSLALVALYNATNGDNWNNKSGWLSEPLYAWLGVTISGGKITKLELPENNLTGSIPNQIGELSNLTVLNLGYNYGLNGTPIPNSIGNLINLTVLNLFNNGHSGSIPETIGNLLALESLDLGANWNLSGSIPAGIWNLTSLNYLNLMGNRFTGSIPATIGNLTVLNTLYLYDNQLSGNIPVEIGNCSNLSDFYIYNNQLSGSIPAEIGNLSNLYFLDLSNNQLSGSIPTEIGNLSNLYFLDLSNNQLSGSIPAEIGNCSNLYNFYIYNNQLSGSIPAEIGNLSNLRYLYLNNNQLTGCIPAEIGNLSNLNSLDLSNNQLEGEIPASFNNLNNIGYLHLNNNRLCGDLPESLAQMFNKPIAENELKNEAQSEPAVYLPDGNLLSNTDKDGILNVGWRLKVENNKFTFANLVSMGIVPDSINEFTYAPQDTILALSYNDANNSLTVLDGKANNNTYKWYYNFEEITEAINDTLLNIEESGSYFCSVSNTVYPQLELTSVIYGTIDNTLLLADSLALVALYNAAGGSNWNNNQNWLSGPLNTWYGVSLNKWRVSKLELPENNLTGSIPNQIGELSNLTVLNLGYNYGLQGTSIPASIGNLINLTELNLFNNGHSGSIPESIGNLLALESLDLGANWDLSGSIPAGIGNLTSLNFLNLGDNSFTGSIPATIGNLVELNVLYLNNNQLSGSIPAEIGNCSNLSDFYIYNNQLSGSIPAEIGNLSNLYFLDLSNNQLSGSIPTEIGNLSNLYFLDLSNNQLSGSIPAEIGNLSNLYYLYLSNNQLSGSIPSEIGNLSNLRYLYLYNNQLSGEIPSSLANATNLRYIQLHYNQLSGAIPEELGNLNIWTLYLNNNQLEGEIPASFANVNFGYLHLNNNNLKGDLPASLSQMFNNPINDPFEKDASELEPAVYLPDGKLLSNTDKDGILNVGWRLKVENNKFTFANLVSMGIVPDSINEFTYAPQDTVFGLELIDATTSLTVHDGKATNNQYQWFYGIEPIDFETNDTIHFIDLNGAYYCKISNSSFPGMTLNSAMFGSINYDITTDSLSLVALYNAALGSNWNNNQNWLTGPLDTWYGVTITNNRVTALYLYGNNLSGNLPDDLGNLTALVELSLGGNYNLQGSSIPVTLGNLTNLTMLDLYNNGHSGNIPSEICHLDKLTILDLGANWNLTGSIPEEIGNLVNLEVLSLYANQLSGNIPASLLSLTNLFYLDICNNIFTPAPMPDFSTLINLTSLYIDGCNFTGSIPQTLLQMGNLQYLSISDNPFTPAPMPDFSTLINLTSLYIDGCNFTGNIPQTLLQMNNLQSLSITSNPFLAAPMPDFSNLSNLRYLNASGCNLTGNLPLNLFTLTNLQNLYLYNNQLSGSIPSEIGNLSNLYYLDLSNNQLSDSIPSEIGNMSQMYYLNLSNNQLTGSIPASFENLDNLGYCHLNNNKLYGNMPALLAQMINKPMPDEGLYQPNYDSEYSSFTKKKDTAKGQKDAAINVRWRLKLENNKFTFANLESLGILPGSINEFTYAPQDTLLALITDGSSIMVNDGNSAQNQFEWYYEGELLSDTTRIIDNMGDGSYWCSVNNSIFTALTLYSDTLVYETPQVPFDLPVSSTTVVSGTDQCFNAENDITVAGTSDVVIQDDATATFIAGHSIRFLPGFHAHNGSYVSAYITTTGSFCDQLPQPIMAAEPVAEKSYEYIEPDAVTKSLIEQSMVVYPNPNNGQFTISLSNFESATRIIMFNAMGQTVYEANITELQHTVDLPNLQRGIYFVKAINQQKQFDQKLIIQ